MARRTRAQHKSDDIAFPVRVKIAVPPFGLGGRARAIDAWLREELGTGRFAVHSAQAISTQAIGIYFQRIEDARAFLAAFPDLQLADGTNLSAYYSPYRPAAPGD